jgi:hypothetical protein
VAERHGARERGGHHPGGGERADDDPAQHDRALGAEERGAHRADRGRGEGGEETPSRRAGDEHGAGVLEELAQGHVAEHAHREQHGRGGDHRHRAAGEDDVIVHTVEQRDTEPGEVEGPPAEALLGRARPRRGLGVAPERVAPERREEEVRRRGEEGAAEVDRRGAVLDEEERVVDGDEAQACRRGVGHAVERRVEEARAPRRADSGHLEALLQRRGDEEGVDERDEIGARRVLIEAGLRAEPALDQVAGDEEQRAEGEGGEREGEALGARLLEGEPREHTAEDREEDGDRRRDDEDGRAEREDVHAARRRPARSGGRRRRRPRAPSPGSRRWCRADRPWRGAKG